MIGCKLAAVETEFPVRIVHHAREASLCSVRSLWNPRTGWVVVAIIFVTALTTAGSFGIPGALILPLTREFGWDPAQISSALAIRFLLFGLMAPFAAALMERYGVRRMVVIAIGLIVTGLCGALVMRTLWQLVVAWGFIVGIGTGLTALTLAAVISNRWFTARRGLVVGILAASTSTGQLVFLPMTAALAEAHGWRVALLPPIAALLVAAILVVLFVADRPSELGLGRYGDTDALQDPAAGQHFAHRGFRPLFRGAGRSRVHARLHDHVRNLLRVRVVDQRPDPDAFHFILRRLWRGGGRGRRRPRRDGRMRYLRDDRLGLAFRSREPWEAPLLLLRIPGPFAAAFAVVGISRSSASRFSRCSMGSIGLPRCRRP